MIAKSVKGRGAADNSANRFEQIALERDPEWGEDDPLPKTQFFRDSARTVLSKNESPDVPFNYSLNPYRGCEHGCIYCYARPTHEYFGLSAGLDFETKIFVKEEAPALLREMFASRRWKPEPVAIGGVTDPYQPVEKQLKLTRKCLEIFAEFQNPVMLITKNHLVTRDIDVLSKLAQVRAVSVCVSITTLAENVRRVMEPRTSPPDQRLAAVKALSEAKIPVGVLVAPVIPGLTDHEIPAILAAAADAGADFAGYVPLRLPMGVGEMFLDWLERHFPDSKTKVMNQIRSLRGGRMNDPNFGSRMRGEGVFADSIEELFRVSCQKHGLGLGHIHLSTEFFRRPQSGYSQMDLFSLN